eukprot:214546_1
MAKRSRCADDGIPDAHSDVEAVLDLVEMRSQTSDGRLTLLLRALARQALLNACSGVASPVQKAVGKMLRSARSEIDISCLRSTLTIFPSDPSTKSLYSRVPRDTLIHIFTFLGAEHLFAINRLASWAPKVVDATITRLTVVGINRQSPKIRDLAIRGLPNCVTLGAEMGYGLDYIQILDRCPNLTDICINDFAMDNLGNHVFPNIRSLRLGLEYGASLDSLHTSIQTSFPSLETLDLFVNPPVIGNLDVNFRNGLLAQLRVLRLNQIYPDELAILLDHFPPTVEILKLALLASEAPEIDFEPVLYSLASKFHAVDTLSVYRVTTTGDRRICCGGYLNLPGRLPQGISLHLRNLEISGLDSTCHKFLSSAVMFPWPNLKRLFIDCVSKTENNAEQFIASSMPNIECLFLSSQSAVEMAETILIGQDGESRFKHLKQLRIKFSASSQVPDLSPACRDLQLLQTSCLTVIRSLTNPGSTLNIREMRVGNVCRGHVERMSRCTWPKLQRLAIRIKGPEFSHRIVTALSRLATETPVLRYVLIAGDSSYLFAFLASPNSLPVLTDIRGLSHMCRAVAFRFLQENTIFDSGMLDEVQRKLRRICG